MRMRLNRGGQPEARAQVEGYQVKYLCIKGQYSHLSGAEFKRKDYIYDANG
jgi:hypothetical protein